MTDRELMQQALDAMLNFPNDISDEMFEAMKVLKARLAQPNDFNPDWDAMAVMVEEQQRMAKRIEELEARLAQPEQEPPCKTGSQCVGNKCERCVVQEPHGYLWFTRHMEQRFTHRKPKEDERVGDVKPVYTAPPQREWQGLTEQEHMQIAIDCGCASADWVFYGAAVERKLKEKNT